MRIDTREDIILPAWKLIKDDSKIKKIQFLPWVLSIIFLSALLSYQSIYTYLVITDKKEELLESLINFIHSTYIVEFILFAVIFILLYILILPIFEWALIRYIAKKDSKGDAEISESISIWLYKFLPLFRYNNLFSEFKLIAVINWYLFILRFFEFQYVVTINYIFFIIFLFSVIINVFFAYSRYIIILENQSMFLSIWKSTKISLMNLKNTLKIYFIMFILNIRVFFNFIVFLIFPILIVAVIWFVTAGIFKILALSIIIIIFILFILLLGYLTWVLEALKTAIWYYAYKKGKERLESIEEEV
jgi:hypothetical protein